MEEIVSGCFFLNTVYVGLFNRFQQNSSHHSSDCGI